MKVLVTGGCGFIGSHLVDKLIEKGHDVRVMDRLEYQVHQGRLPDYLNPVAEYIFGDMGDANLLPQRQRVCRPSSTRRQWLRGAVHVPDTQIRGGQHRRHLPFADFLANQSHDVKSWWWPLPFNLFEGAYHCTECGEVYPKLRTKEQLQAMNGDEVPCLR